MILMSDPLRIRRTLCAMRPCRRAMSIGETLAKERRDAGLTVTPVSERNRTNTQRTRMSDANVRMHTDEM